MMSGNYEALHELLKLLILKLLKLLGLSNGKSLRQLLRDLSFTQFQEFSARLSSSHKTYEMMNVSRL